MTIKPRIAAPLDSGFQPAVLFNRNYIKAARASGTAVPLVIGLEREAGLLSRFETVVRPDADTETILYVERIVKFLLWARGGWRIHFGGPRSIGEKIQQCYSKTGARAFDAEPVRGTLNKEAWEEAGIPATLAARAELEETVEIHREQPDGLQRETIFVHDLALPADFRPCNQDGEAVEHRLVSLDEAARLIANASGPQTVTTDASLVVLDFLLRHGAIAADVPERTALEALLTLASPLSRAAAEGDR